MSPCRPRETALQRLQFAEEMAEMLAVVADAATLLHPVIGRKRQRRLGNDAADDSVPPRLQARRVDRDAGIDQAALGVVDREHLAGIGPEMIDRLLRPRMALRGTVTKADDPFRAMADMIGAFLLGFRCDRGERRVL